ncbi:hypothetical protein C0995_012491 [Termitomyces sp. Mi166|nr:hypothetical protein C0995_012491 [Termitomyces sp. Mi166\
MAKEHEINRFVDLENPRARWQGTPSDMGRIYTWVEIYRCRQKLFAGFAAYPWVGSSLLLHLLAILAMSMCQKSKGVAVLSPTDPAYSNEQALPSSSNTLWRAKEHIESTAQENSETIPEGGIRAWLTVLGGTMVTFCTFGVVQSFGVYQDYYTCKHIITTKIFLRKVLGWGLEWVSCFCLLYKLPHITLEGGDHLQWVLSFQRWWMSLPNTVEQLVLKNVRIWHGCQVCISNSEPGDDVYLREISRAVAFMDLGLLIIANLVMKARLPPKQRGTQGGSVFKEVITDGPYLLFVFGSFLLYAVLHGVSPAFVKYSVRHLDLVRPF